MEVPKVGLSAAPRVVTLALTAEPLKYPVLEVRTVTVDATNEETPVTVTRPLLEIEADPNAELVADQEKALS